MTEDVYVQVLNPKTKQYILINKTKGIIVETTKDDKPFSDIEIVTAPEGIKGLTSSPTGRLASSIVQSQNIPNSIAQHVSRVLDQTKIDRVFDEAVSLGDMMESIPEFVESKNKDSEWDGSRYKKCPVKWHKKLDIDPIQKVSVGSKCVQSLPYQKGKTWLKNSGSKILCDNRGDIYHTVISSIILKPAQQKALQEAIKTYISTPKATKKPSDEFTFNGAVKKAMKMNEKSLADKAYDKFKDDEYKHTRKLKETLRRIVEIETPVTAYDVKASMIIMWELLQKGYIEDVTPAARTGGATTPDTTYCYKITNDGRIFIIEWGYAGEA